MWKTMQNEHASKLLVPFLGPPVEAIPGTGWGPTTPTAFSVPLHYAATSKNTQTKHSALAPETSLSEIFGGGYSYTFLELREYAGGTGK